MIALRMASSKEKRDRIISILGEFLYSVPVALIQCFRLLHSLRFATALRTSVLLVRHFIFVADISKHKMLWIEFYCGKTHCTGFRRDDGNVGIIRSPVRTIALLDLLSSGRTAAPKIRFHMFPDYSSLVAKDLEIRISHARGAGYAVNLVSL